MRYMKKDYHHMQWFLQTLAGILTCSLITWCIIIQYKMNELQHNLTQLESKNSFQFTEIKNWQDLHGKAFSNFEKELLSLKLSTENLAQSVEQQWSQTKTTIEKQFQLRKDMTRCSEDLLNLHAVYAKHFTYPQTYVDKAKDELKLQFEVEKGKIFKTLYEEKLNNFHDILEIHLTKYESLKVVKFDSSNQHASESRLTKKVLMQMFNDLKTSMKKWIMTLKSTLYFWQGRIHQQVSEIDEIRLWTVRYVQQKLKHNKKFIDALNIHMKNSKRGILALNDTINSVKSFWFSYPSFANKFGHEMKRKCSKALRGMETLQYKPDGVLSPWVVLIIPILLTSIYFPWTNWSSGNKEVVKQWMMKKFLNGNEKKPPPHSDPKEKLEHSLCVVNFGCGSDKQKYVHLASDLMGSGFSLQMKKVVVNSTESLETLPPSKVILMFVDYNERNLIIEEEHGGLKRKTLSMLQKTGAEVTVVYCYELSSKHLDEGRLFAQKLTVIDRMKELRELRERNSIFSIYDKFNPTQKEVFRSKLNNFN
ncbi:uncharacterized protein LOC133192363 [Saccostrea echinata]|uniref:uncharacterized protein LOC133192363 n=2 Tax=Saccostrea echinata TaxID=191078 RepID=UPI002A7EAFA8|nr:uncharacterized protein LOC133192363 [Saccostrea echinata]